MAAMIGSVPIISEQGVRAAFRCTERDWTAVLLLPCRVMIKSSFYGCHVAVYAVLSAAAWPRGGVVYPCMPAPGI